MISDELIEKAHRGEIGKEDAIELLSANPFELFSLADELRRNAVGDEVSYVINRNIYLTNMCAGNCGFCAFKTEKGHILSTDEVLEEVEKAQNLGAT
jgi:FO synthase subunit 2